MEILTYLVRIGLLAVVIAAAICLVAYGLTRLSEAVDVIDRADDIYDWDAEDDFPAAPVYLTDDHNPLLSITEASVSARCSCGKWDVIVAIRGDQQQRAYDIACDLFWTGHIAPLGATA